MLRLEGVWAGYRPGVAVLRDLHLTVEAGEVVTLIGSNGAGKTTTLRTICGQLHPSQGRIWFEDRDISRLPPARLVASGIAVVPEGRHLFPTMTVEENLLVGAYAHWDSDRRRRLDEVYDLFPALTRLRRRPAHALSGGEQQMVAIGRALMAAPRLLLLDEPSMGLAPVLVEEIFQRFDHLRRQGVTILVVEQNAAVALHMANRAYVLEQGTIAIQGSARELLGHPAVQRSYLGL